MANDKQSQIDIYEMILAHQFKDAGLTSNSSSSEINYVMETNENIRENWNKLKKLREE
jgi:hypothetical protein